MDFKAKIKAAVLTGSVIVGFSNDVASPASSLERHYLAIVEQLQGDVQIVKITSDLGLLHPSFVQENEKTQAKCFTNYRPLLTMSV